MSGSAVVHVGLALALLVVVRRAERPEIPVNQSVAVVFASPKAAALPVDRRDAEEVAPPQPPSATPPVQPLARPIPEQPPPRLPVAPPPPMPVVPPPPQTPPPPEEVAPSPMPVAPSPPAEAFPPVALPLPPRAPPPPPVRRLRAASPPISRPPVSAAPPTTTGEVSEPAAQSAAAPAAALPAGAPPAAAVTGWREALGAWLAAHKTYPEDARRRGEEGRAAVRFTMDRSGRVLEVELSQSSGSAILDEAARAMLRGVTLPPLPPTMTQERITVTVTLRYALAP